MNVLYIHTSNLESYVSGVPRGSVYLSPLQLGSRESLGGPGESLLPPPSVDQQELLLTGPHTAEVWAQVHPGLEGRLADDCCAFAFRTQ